MNILLNILLIILVNSVAMFNIDFQLFEDILNEEKEVINSMKTYIKSKENKLKVFKEFVNTYEENVFNENNITFWENPILTYLVIKRITYGWNRFLDSFGSEKALISNKFIKSLKNYTSVQYFGKNIS